MNLTSIKLKLRACKRCVFLCASCPHALPCDKQGQTVRPTECYICWHNQGTVLPSDCALRHKPAPRSQRRTELTAGTTKKPAR